MTLVHHLGHLLCVHSVVVVIFMEMVWLVLLLWSWEVIWKSGATFVFGEQM
jgi:hypothetical protein